MKYFYVSYFVSFSDSNFSFRARAFACDDPFFNYAEMVKELTKADKARDVTILSWKEITKEHFEYVGEYLKNNSEEFKGAEGGTLEFNK